MWGNPMREILFSFRKVNITTEIQFPAREIHLQHPTPPQIFCLEKCAKYVLLYGPLNNTLKLVPHQNCMSATEIAPLQPIENTTKMPRKFHVQQCLKSHPFLSVVRTVRICTVRPLSAVSYNTSSQTKLPWDLCPLSLGKSAQPAAPNFLFKLTQKILSKTCLAHCPRFTLIAENDFSHLNVFSPSPSLDLMAKI
jgi:hypothetical protein